MTGGDDANMACNSAGRARSGDEDDAIGRVGRVGPRLLDLGKGDGPGADVEGALGDRRGDLGNLLGEVASGYRADAAADDVQARRAQRSRRDGSLRAGDRA